MPLTTPIGRVVPDNVWAGVALCLGLLLPQASAIEYRSQSSLSTQLKQLASDHADLVQVKELAVTAGKHELWLMEVGAGPVPERKQRPAMLVVAGIEGNDLVSTASVLNWVEHLIGEYPRESATRTLLDGTTLYIFPRANPDAAESFFAIPRLERTTNLTPTDDDHDGLVDEDGPEDLNGDGLVSSMRVQDPEGEYILDPTDPRVLLKADKAKGEKGAWKLLAEGIDNDKDEQWNEDGLGGVNLNRNFPFGYQFFGPASGPHQVSEVETRALADFVVSHPNIGVAFTFGSADNLIQTPKSEPGGKRPPAAISDADVPFYRELGQAYREAVGLKKELTGTTEPGSLSDWLYFHRGRLSLAAKPWSLPLEIELDKQRKAEQEKGKEGAASEERKEKSDEQKPDGKDKTAGVDKSKGPKPALPVDMRGEDERAMLKWVDENAPESFLPWKEFSHPDFPNQKVEIGGWAPFAQSNPPAKLLDQVSARYAKFLTTLAGKLPRIAMRKAAAKHLGSSVYELTLQVENTGYLPTALAQGALTREVLKTRVVLSLEDKQILAGQKTTLLGPIAGSGGMEELRYILQASGSVQVEAISALGGSVRQTIELKETP